MLVNPALAEDFNFTLKQRGGLFAKGRILGIQFEELFKDNLYLELGAHANRLAARLKSAFEDKGFSFLVDSSSNQIFPILPNELIAGLRRKTSFRDQETIDEGHTAVRFVTSWAMTDAMVDSFIEDLDRLCHE